MNPSVKLRGFTLIETLVGITVVSALSALVVPLVEGTKETTKRAKCANNVRQITLHLISTANQNPNKQFPANNSSGAWAWDVSHAVVSGLVSQAGRSVLYCPFSPMTTTYPLDALYTYSGRPMAVTTYVLLVPGTRQVMDGPGPATADYLSERIQAQYTSGVSTIPAAQRHLVVDAVISRGANFVNISGGLPGNVSNHMAGNLPAGGHSGYVDGHVAWRDFQMATLSNPGGFSVRTMGTPSFWF